MAENSRFIQPFDEDIVYLTSPAVHGDLHAGGDEVSGEARAGSE